MLKVATVFSGIGAIEQALKRMNIPHEIVFACDNGGVDLLKPESDTITEKYLKDKIKFLENEISLLKEANKEDDYIEFIEKKLERQKEELFNYVTTNLELDKEKFREILEILKICSKKFEGVDLEASSTELMESYLFKVYDFATPANIKKLNNEFFTSYISQLKENIGVKKIKREYSEIYQELHQIEQVLETQIHLINLQKIESPLEKKKYVDDIYGTRISGNNVRKSYLENYPLSSDNFHLNISLLDGKSYSGGVDLFVGGSPCQSFSMAGKRKGLTDTRGTLFYEFVRLIEEIQPRFFIYENVKGMLSHDKGKTWEVIQESFKGLGYHFTTEILNAKDFGIPQRRERIFVIGYKNEKDKGSGYIEKVSNDLTMLDFLLDNNQSFVPDELPKFKPLEIEGLEVIFKKDWYSDLILSDVQKKFVSNPEKLKKQYTQLHDLCKEIYMNDKNEVVEKFGEIPEKKMLTQKAHQQYNLHGDFIEYDFNKLILSEKVKNYVLDEESSYNKKDLKSQLNTEIAKTIVASCHKMHRVSVDNYLCYINDELKDKPLKDRVIRKLHPRECLRLMGFGDDFKIVVSSTEAYKQAGNSIVVDVLIGILKSMKNII